MVTDEEKILAAIHDGEWVFCDELSRRADLKLDVVLATCERLWKAGHIAASPHKFGQTVCYAKPSRRNWPWMNPAAIYPGDGEP